MFEVHSTFSLCGYNGLPVPAVSRHAQLFNQAISLFNKARRNSIFVRIRAALLRRTTALLDLSILPQNRVLNQCYGGTKTVNLDQIIGTLGRVGDFDNHFYPLSLRTRSRWISVAMARSLCLPLEPVKLIQVGEHYFVEDGHHRISVARTRGETAIDAEIIIWKVSGSLPWETRPASDAHPVLEHLSI